MDSDGGPYDELFSRMVPIEVCAAPVHRPAHSTRAPSTKSVLDHHHHNHHSLCTCLGCADGAMLRAVPGSSAKCSSGGGPVCLLHTVGGGEVHLRASSTSSSSAGAHGSRQRSSSSGSGGARNNLAMNGAEALEAAGGVQRVTVRLLGHRGRCGPGGRSGASALRLELFSDAVLFFHFTSIIDDAAFEEIKDTCDLNLCFAQVPSMLLQLCELLVRQPTTFLARLIMRPDGSAALEFAQALGFKTTSLLVLPQVQPTVGAAMRGYVVGRHRAALARCAAVEGQLAALRALVRQRCPNLLLKAVQTGWATPKGAEGTATATTGPQQQRQQPHLAGSMLL